MQPSSGSNTGIRSFDFADKIKSALTVYGLSSLIIPSLLLLTLYAKLAVTFSFSLEKLLTIIDKASDIILLYVDG